MPSYHLEDSYNSRFFDGSENTIAGVNENGSVADHDGSDLVLVIQFGRYAAGACNKTTNAEHVVLQVSEDGGGFQTIDDSTTPVRFTANTSLVNGNATPDRITAGTMTDGSGGSCGNGWEGGEESEDADLASIAVSANYFKDAAFGLDFSNASTGVPYTFQLYNVDTSAVLTPLTAIGSVTLASAPAIPRTPNGVFNMGGSVERIVTFKRQEGGDI